MLPAHTTFQRQNEHRLAERRLCHMVPPPGERPTESGMARRAETTANWINEWIAQPVRDTFVGVTRGLTRGVTGAPSEDDRRELLGAAEFMSTAPRSLAGHIERVVREQSLSDKGTMIQLTKHANWLNAIKDIGFTAAVVPIPGPNSALPINIVASLPTAEREQIFADYFKALIPDTVRRRPVFKDVFGDGADDPTKFLAPGNVTIILNAMQDMVGMKSGEPIPAAPVPPAPASPEYLAWSLASQSLTARYHQENPDGSALNGGAPTGTMVNEYRGLRRMNPGRPTRTVQDIRRLSTGTMFGAAASERFNIIDNDDLTALNAPDGPVAAADRREALRLPGTVAALDRLTRTTETHVEREAMTIYDKWRELPPMVKIVTLAALGYLAMKRPKAAAALVVAGVGTYMLTDKDMLNGLFKRGQALAGPRAPDRAVLERRAQVMYRFLSERARTRVESELTGFVLLADTPMPILTAGTQMNPDGMSGRLVLNNVQRQAVRTTLKAKGYDDRAIDRYLGECTANPRAAGDAIVATFYVMASMSPAHREEGILVEQKIGQMPPGHQSIQYIRANVPVGDPRRTTADGRDIVDLYKSLIEFGRAEASTSGDLTLGDVATRALNGGVFDASPGLSAEDAEANRIFDTKVSALEESFNGQTRKLSAKRNGPNVTIGVKQERILGSVRETQFDGSTVDVPLNDFLTKDPDQIKNAWLDAIGAKKTTDYNNEIRAPRMKFERDGNDIKYFLDPAVAPPGPPPAPAPGAPPPAPAPGPAPAPAPPLTAKSPALVLIATPNTTIQQKFNAWVTARPADPDALRMP